MGEAKNITTFDIYEGIKIPFSGTEEDKKRFFDLCEKRNIKNRSAYLRKLIQRELKNKTGGQYKTTLDVANDLDSFKDLKHKLPRTIKEYLMEDPDNSFSEIIRNIIKKETGGANNEES